MSAAARRLPLGTRLGRWLASVQERAALDVEARGVVRGTQLRAAARRASRLRGDARRDRDIALADFGEACGRRLLGEVEEEAVERAERALADAERLLRRAEAAERWLRAARP
jgi:hypothetical protein